MAVAAELAQRGVLVTLLSSWGLPGWIRISFGTHAENEMFVAALREVLSAADTADEHRASR